MTMTKHNPRFAPPELWVLGSAGDYFGEFMAGGIAVICGHEPQNSENVLGYRPFVGMVGGKVFFRGPHSGYSRPDAKLVPIKDDDWNWLAENLKVFLQRIDGSELYKTFSELMGPSFTRRFPTKRSGSFWWRVPPRKKPPARCDPCIHIERIPGTRSWARAV